MMMMIHDSIVNGLHVVYVSIMLCLHVHIVVSVYSHTCELTANLRVILNEREVKGLYLAYLAFLGYVGGHIVQCLVWVYTNKFTQTQ